MNRHHCGSEGSDTASGSTAPDSDQRHWHAGVAQCQALYRTVQPEVQQQLNILLEQIIVSRDALMAQVAKSDNTPTCRRCGGECCLFGKYHVTPLDILAMLYAGNGLPEPDFSGHPACPYATETGCTMNAAFRPVTCIIFNCEQLEQHFDETARHEISRLEHALRTLVAACNRLLDARLDRPLLLWAADTLTKETHYHDSH